MIQPIRRVRALSGTVSLPGDKSISHRYAMLAAVAEGTSEIRHFASSQDCHSTLGCLERLGVPLCVSGEDITITGVGLHGFKASERPLDAGNSGTTIRLLSGLLAGQDFETTIGGDDSLSRRPMRRVAEPLRLMGATVKTRQGDLPPLRIKGGKLKAVRYSLPVASAQVKSCVLLAGLYTDGVTAVFEPVPTRDHTEIALQTFGATLTRKDGWIEVNPSPRLEGLRLEVPGDLSGAAFFLVAAALTPGSNLLLQRVGLNERRRELLDYLQSAGLDIVVEREETLAGEPRGDLRVRHDARIMNRALPTISGARAASLIDEIPVLSILGSQVAGGLEVSDAQELRVKESDRIATIAANFRTMGATVEEKPDGLIIPGNQRLHGCNIDTRGDHRIAMAFAVAGLVAHGETRIHQAECADVSFPGFWQALAGISVHDA